MTNQPPRFAARSAVIRNFSLSATARLLYVLFDDLAGNDDEICYHWRKLAFFMGLSRTRFFEVVEELATGGMIAIRREGRRVYYNLHSFRFSGTNRENSFRFSDTFIPLNRNEPASHLITDLRIDLRALTASAEDKTPDALPDCYRCRDTGREILGKRGICKCSAGDRIRRAA